MDTKLLKVYIFHTFCLFERALLVPALTLGGILSCRALVVGALTGALFCAAFASSDIWPLLFPLVGPFLWSCCTLGVHRVEAYWSAEPWPLESPVISELFLRCAAVL